MASCRSYSDACQEHWTWCRWNRSAAPPPRRRLFHRRRRWLAPRTHHVNEYAPEKRLLLNLEAIAYHEGVPGHHLHFRSRRNSRIAAVPQIQSRSQRLYRGWRSTPSVWEKKWDSIRPYSEYGRLQNESGVRAVVVDTGVHSQHWTRQQMVDYFHEHTAMDEENIDTEVDRYSHGRRRRFLQNGADEDLELRARAQSSWGRNSISAPSTTRCWIRARCRLMCWNEINA